MVVVGVGVAVVVGVVVGVAVLSDLLSYEKENIPNATARVDGAG